MHVYRTPSPFFFPEYQPAYWSPAQHEALTRLRDWYGATHGLLDGNEVRRLLWVRWLRLNNRVGWD